MPNQYTLGVIFCAGEFVGEVQVFHIHISLKRLTVEPTTELQAGVLGELILGPLRLLEHGEQRFRLSYLLGNLMSRGDELSDDEEDGSAEKGDEQPEVSDAEREAMSQRIQGFLKRM